MKYRNPILPGFYPDPSVIRVGADYYMVTSTFEYFPGVPVFHSRDLIRWRQIGHCLTRRSQVDLLTRKSSEGIFAPTIRFHNGLFYMITTDVQGIGNFYVTAKDPAGPWSDPVPVPHCNIDPSLFFDDDGKVYVTSQKGRELESHVIQFELDIRTGEALTEPAVIWRGDGGPWCEGPHLYKIRGMYYLLSACGGTAKDHREIIGRGTTPYGPFERLPHPILTHNGLPGHPVQNLGHAELVEDIHGDWWAFFLGTRPVDGQYSILGRETFLAPVVWTVDGWPLIDNNAGTVGLLMESPFLSGESVLGTTEPSNSSAGLHTGIVSSAFTHADAPTFNPAARYVRTSFAPGSSLGLEWCYVRREPEAGALSLGERPGWLRLTGGGDTLASGGVPHYICRRQQHRSMRVETLIDYRPAAPEEAAGLALRLSDTTHYTLTLRRNVIGGRSILVDAMVKGTGQTASQVSLSPDSGDAPVRLAIRSDATAYEFLYSMDGEHWSSLCTLPAGQLSPEFEFGFTGVTVGMYAVSGSPEPTGAFFSYFEYSADPES